MTTFRQTRQQLDDTLAELENTDTSEIDQLVALHKKALKLIDQLEKQLAAAQEQTKKLK